MSLQKIESGRKTKHTHESTLQTHRRDRVKQKEANGADNLLTYALFGLLLLCVIAVIYIVLNPPMGEKYTEFYILGPEEKAYNYPISLQTGQSGTVYIGIVNKEQEPMDYVLRVRLDNETMQEKDLTLVNGQAYKGKFTFTPHTAGDKRKLEFLLFKKGYSTPYRDLHLWIDVKAAE
jgi:uncharacterized membrane protein